MALVAALALMTVLGLLVVSAVGTVVVAQRSAELLRADATLGADADYAIGTVLGDPAYGLANLPLSTPRRYAVSLSSGALARVTATRLPDNVLWLVAERGAAPPDSGRRLVNLVARFPWLGPVPPSPLVARGGVVATEALDLRVDTATDADCAVAGPPALLSTVVADSDAYLLTARQHAALDSAVGTSAVVHIRGDTTLGGGAFNGLLIVDGSVTITAGFTLSGLLIARDSIVAASGLAVHGALMAFSSSPGAIRLSHALIEYSPCQIALALRRATRPAPARGRAWAELF